MYVPLTYRVSREHPFIVTIGPTKNPTRPIYYGLIHITIYLLPNTLVWSLHDLIRKFIRIVLYKLENTEYRNEQCNDRRKCITAIQSVFEHFASEFLQTFPRVVSLDNDQECNENGDYLHKRKNFETHYSCAYVAIYT